VKPVARRHHPANVLAVGASVFNPVEHD
jgi:hypothetical protein